MSKDCLIPFKPGQSGNPAGKKKGTKNTATILRKIWAAKMNGTDPATGKMRKMSIGELASYAIAQKASKGDVIAYREILDRLDGKVVQPMEHAGAGGSPLAPPIINVEFVPGGVEGE